MLSALQNYFFKKLITKYAPVTSSPKDHHTDPAKDACAIRSEEPRPLRTYVQFQGLEGVGYGLFFQEQMNRKLLLLTMVLGITLAIALCAIVWLALAETKPVYFGVNQEMQIIPMYPLEEPMYTDAALKSWAAQAAREIFNLDFLNWREQLSNARTFFTKRAYLSFAKSLKEEGHLKLLSQYRALMHGVLQGTPIIVAAGVLNKRMTWELEVPFQLAYETSEKVLSHQSFIISMRIQRVSTAEYVQGIAISQLVVAREGKVRQPL